MKKLPGKVRPVVEPQTDDVVAFVAGLDNMPNHLFVAAGSLRKSSCAYRRERTSLRAALTRFSRLRRLDWQADRATRCVRHRRADGPVSVAIRHQIPNLTKRGIDPQEP